MKLKYIFETVDMGDEFIAVPVGDNAEQIHGVLKLNKAGNEILSLLNNDTTEEQIVELLSEKYENNNKELTAYVNKFIRFLQDNDMLEN